jgi:hypothetical protein
MINKSICDVKGRPRARPSGSVTVFNGLLWTASLIMILMLHCACIYDKILMHSPNGIWLVDNLRFIT